MPDYGYGALAPAIGAQEGLAVLLKQRLMERAQKLAELTQQQTAAQHQAEMDQRASEVGEARKFREDQFKWNRGQDEQAAADRQENVLRLKNTTRLNDLQEQYAPGDTISNPQDQPDAARLMPGLVKLRPAEAGTAPLEDAPWVADYQGTATQRRQITEGERADARLKQTISNQSDLDADRDERMDRFGWSVQTVQTPDGSFKTVRVNARDGRVEPVDLGGNIATTVQRNLSASLKRVAPIIEGVTELSEKINTGQGVIAKLVGTIGEAEAKANLDDDIAEYVALVESFTPLWARALGHTGVLTQLDVDSAKKILPAPGDSKSLRDRKIARITKTFAAAGGKLTTEETPPANEPSSPGLVRKPLSAIRR